MKLAFIHDWLVSLGGAERVLKELHRIFPDAPIYTLFADTAFTRQHFPDAHIVPTWLQHIPAITRFYRFTALLMPTAIESIDLSAYDVVLSSSVFFGKGIILKPQTKHVSYCYSPPRQLWDRAAEYELRGVGARITQHVLRLWDFHAAQRPDKIIAISRHVQNRVKKYYKRNADVLYPPLAAFPSLPDGERIVPPHDPYFLIVSRLHTYKNIHIAVEAFQRLG